MDCGPVGAAEAEGCWKGKVSAIGSDVAMWVCCVPLGKWEKCDG